MCEILKAQVQSQKVKFKKMKLFPVIRGLPANAGSVPALGRFGEGNGNPLQCPCLENPMDGGA